METNLECRVEEASPDLALEAMTTLPYASTYSKIWMHNPKRDISAPLFFRYSPKKKERFVRESDGSELDRDQLLGLVKEEMRRTVQFDIPHFPGKRGGGLADFRDSYLDPLVEEGYLPCMMKIWVDGRPPFQEEQVSYAATGLSGALELHPERIPKSFQEDMKSWFNNLGGD